MRKGLIPITPITLSSTAKIATPPMVPTMLPLPPASSVPPSTTAAIEKRSYRPWLPMVGLPMPVRDNRVSPASAANIAHSTCATMTG